MKRISVKREPVWVLNRETFCPMKQWLLRLNIEAAAQHDGRAWTDEEVEQSENELHDEIMEEVRPIIRELISNTDPFSTHR
jgi:hypothetical protein